jgi:hypothetical protein
MKPRSAGHLYVRHREIHNGRHFMSKRIPILRVLALLVLFASAKAEASCGAGYEGTYPQGEIHIGTGDCDYEEIMIVVRPHPEYEPKAYPYRSECLDITNKNGKRIGFSCRKDGQSPLDSLTGYISMQMSQISSADTKTPPSPAILTPGRGRVDHAIQLLNSSGDGRWLEGRRPIEGSRETLLSRGVVVDRSMPMSSVQ